VRKFRALFAAAVGLCILLAAVPALAQQLKLLGPKEASLNVPFEVSVEGLALPLSTFQSAPPQITWLVLCGEAQVKQRLELLVTMQDGKPVWSAAPYVTVTALKPARLAVVLTVDTAGGFARQASLEVTCGPFPDPKPDPKPDPDPNPQPGKRWIILIEETAERQKHPGLSELISSPTWRAYLKNKGHELRVWDKQLARAGRAPRDAASWFSRAGDKQPVLFIADEAGKALYEGPPPDVKDAVQLVQKYGG